MDTWICLFKPVIMYPGALYSVYPDRIQRKSRMRVHTTVQGDALVFSTKDTRVKALLQYTAE